MRSMVEGVLHMAARVRRSPLHRPLRGRSPSASRGGLALAALAAALSVPAAAQTVAITGGRVVMATDRTRSTTARW
jgi:hypothetical protein